MVERADHGFTERVGVVGGGILGIAIARALMEAGDFDVTVLEKENRVASHQTGRNSGVVHAGLYYQPGSLKAALCVRGRHLTKEFCQDRNLPYHERGKLVVAVSAEELPALADIALRSRQNQVPGLCRLEAQEMNEIEPHVRGLAALHSPKTAVVDYAAITEAMAGDVRRAGGTILLGQQVLAVQETGKSVTVVTSASSHSFHRLIVCAGLQSDVVAQMVGASPSPKILPFRGEYWIMASGRRDLVRGMIYPVPDPRFPFLGVHFTRGVYDEVHVGPNAVPALTREGYTWRNISLKDTYESIRWPGAATLFKQHWRAGLREISSSLVKPLYYQQARRFIPELQPDDLVSKAASGVRAQAWDKDGSLLDDFVVDQIDRVTLIRNAPSPAATSSISIAEHVLEKYLKIVPRLRGRTE